MRVDRPQLKRLVHEYLRSPEVDELCRRADNPVISWLVTSCALIFGIVCLPTIFWTRLGLKVIYDAVTLHGGPGSSLKRNLNDYEPVIAFTVRLGPSELAVILTSFEEAVQSDLDFLSEKAGHFESIFYHGAVFEDDQAIEAILKRPLVTRWRVPDSHSEHKVLWLEGIHLDVSMAAPNSSYAIACVAVPGEAGQILQIPWKVVAPAVDLD